MAYFHTTVLDNQIKALPTVDTASGSIATFDTDMTENLIEVKCQILAKQEGSGNPSPSNPRPITTYSEMNVVNMGDITNKAYFEGLLNGTYGFVDLGSLTFGTSINNCQNAILPNTPAQNTAGTQPNAILSNGFTYSGSAYGVGSVDKTYCFNNGRLWLYDSALAGKTPAEVKTALSGVYLIYELATPTTPTITESQFNDLLSAFGIDGEMHNIPFGQTVAQGVLNVGTGKLRVTHGIKKISEISWSRNGTHNVYYGHCVGKKVGRGNVISDNYNTNPVYWEQMNNFDIAGTLGTDELNIKDTSFTSLTDFETNRANVVIVFELETPITVQLSATQITALLNENNIWCDTGDTEVKYLLTVGKAIS